MEAISKTQPIGFFALWKNKPSEYHADEDEKVKTLQDIQGAFTATKANGTKIFTNFETRWSTERQYFAFWETPSFNVLEDAMNHLERAGDFKFAESEHIIGLKVDNQYSKDVDPEILKKKNWLGCFLIWKWTAAFYDTANSEKEAIKKQLQNIIASANNYGAEIFGYYDCRFATEWDHFSFSLFPSYELFEELVEQIEKSGLNKYAIFRQVIGMHVPKYRFARNYIDD